MPILTHKDGWNNDPTVVVFVGPDRQGVFPVEEDYGESCIPPTFDPLNQESVRMFLDASHDSDRDAEDVSLDYSEVKPTRQEQILRITGLGLYRKPFYLSALGDGIIWGKQPQPQPKPHVYEVFSFTSIRPEGLYRRRRDEANGHDVNGWETHGAFYTRMENCEGIGRAPHYLLIGERSR